jgi:hypothetical protein
MKVSKLVSLAAVVFGLVGFGIWSGARAADEPEDMQPNVKLFMEAKLKHSQEALQGLAIEDFDKIAASAQKMSLLSQAEQWQVLETPEYVQRSAEFRREADALRDAAKKKNLDAATLAFVKVTMNCVECHKYVRGVRAADVPAAPTSKTR